MRYRWCMAGPVRFRVLGPVQVVAPEGPVDVGGATARAVLAVLLVRGDAGVSTEEVISSVWGAPGAATRDSVYHYLSDIRKVLSRVRVGAELESRRPRYRLLVDPDAVDWHRFRRLVGAARTARDRGEQQRAAAVLREGLELWHGDPLSDVGDRLEPLRRDLAEQRWAAVETLAAVEAQLGHPQEVVDLLLDGMATGPIREGAAALLIDALTALGRRDDAGDVYRLVYHRLVDERGLEPGAQLAAAHRRALQSPGAMVSAPAKAADRPISGLPRTDRHFTDREAELRSIVESVGVTPHCAIHGMGGSGKTALAVRAAQALEETFPDGIIFLDLHGYAEQRAALTPAETLDRLVRRMRVDSVRIPTDFDELGAFYHDLLDGRRLLLVLDNAHDAGQVRAALPRPGGCAAIVTSRRRLSALDEALMLPLDVLPPDEAMKLFREVAGAARLDAEPRGATTLRRVVDLCGRLPLALRIAAARYRASPRYPLSQLEAGLSGESDRLAELDDDDRSVAASFRLSFNDLPGPVAQTFLLLALHLGSFDAYSTAALADISVREAARHLRQLADLHLVADHGPERLQFHDLVAVFARQHGSTTVPADAQKVALRRLADHFLRTADLADRRITPHRYRVELDLLDPPTPTPSMPDYDTALQWLTRENGNLERVCLAAGEAGFDTVCWQLAYTLRGYYYLTKRWQPWTTTHEAAVIAARRCGDTRAEAMTENHLGLSYIERDAPERAAGHYERAKVLFDALDDQHGAHTARANLAWIHFAHRDYRRFLDDMRPVYDFYVREGSPRNAAITLRGIGLAEAASGRTEEAIADLRTALDMFVRLDGLRLDTAMTFNALGELYQQTGDTGQAIDAFTRAVTTAEQSGSIYEQARAHHGIGEIAAAKGDRDEAHRHWESALKGYLALRAPHADRVREKLENLDDHR